MITNFEYKGNVFDFGGGSGAPNFVEVANYAALPAAGDSSVIYVTLDTNKLYRWSGSTYVEISPMEVPTLASVLDTDNESGANDISFDTAQGLYFANTSRLREGTIDAGLGGTKGVAQICAVGYELKWEAGRLYVMDGNGTGIRHSLYNFTITPTVNEDVTKGYGVGSRWSLDDGTIYVCTDPTTGAAIWQYDNHAGIPVNIQAAASDETTALTTGTGKVTFRVPSAFTLTGVRASLTTAQDSGSILTVDINQNGSSLLSTLLTIDNTEKTSVTAASPAVISTSAISDDAEITIDIDQIGDGTATGLKITLIGVR
jgi:hypothetical protein